MLEEAEWMEEDVCNLWLNFPITSDTDFGTFAKGISAIRFFSCMKGIVVISSKPEWCMLNLQAVW